MPGAQYFETGITYEAGESGKILHWRCIRDDWEWADDPKYSEKWASLAYRIAANYFVYDLTH